MFGFWKKKRDAGEPAAEVAAAAAPLAVAPAADAPAIDSAPRKPVLKLKYGGVRHRVSADDGEIMIGREPKANILVAAPHVSRHHATIIWDDRGYPLLVNLSKSGTSILADGGTAPVVVDGSERIDGAGRIGLCADYAFAEQNQTLVVFEAKWTTRS